MLDVFRYSLIIPFHLSDPAGILFFGHVLSLAHQAFEQFVIQQLECPWTQWFQNSDWIVPVKHAEADYIHPLLAGKECVLEILPVSITTCSFTIMTSIYQVQLCCIVKTLHVFCARANQKKIPIPSHFLSLLQKNLKI